jgi:hypothetical protein
MKVHISISSFEVTHAEKVEAQDIIDGIRTLRPASKIVIEISHPGEGPDHFLTGVTGATGLAHSVPEIAATVVAQQPSGYFFHGFFPALGPGNEFGRKLRTHDPAKYSAAHRIVQDEGSRRLRRR